MAVRSKYSQQVQAYGQQSKQPPSFRATGAGLAVARGGFEATAGNANGSLRMRNYEPSNRKGYLGVMYLFVDEIETSWSLSGVASQTALSRTWQARNLVPGPLTITGTMMNQHEYDKLVEFVQAHHRHIVDSNDNITDQFDPVMVPCVDFSLFQPAGPYTYRHAPGHINPPDSRIKGRRPFSVAIAIKSVSAGHERFQQAPAFTLECVILQDYLQANTDVAFEIMEKMQWQQIYGAFASPAAQSTVTFDSNLTRGRPHKTVIKGGGSSPPGGGPPSSGGPPSTPPPPTGGPPPPPPPSGGGLVHTSCVAAGFPPGFYTDSTYHVYSPTGVLVATTNTPGNFCYDAAGNVYSSAGKIYP